MSIGIPIKLLHEAVSHVVTVETKAGDLYRGTLSSAEDNMNVQLRSVTYTRRDGKVTNLEHVFIRGSKVRFMVIPDMLENAPMFERLQALKEGKAKLGVSEGAEDSCQREAEDEGVEEEGVVDDVTHCLIMARATGQRRPSSDQGTIYMNTLLKRDCLLNFIVRCSAVICGLSALW
eukprot:CAMPEP_0198730352 /NCGR_PEP_ID=MMETSP1475-20131203/24179_1 /TAXON_ID= ORGANISM="Unidentified sp., Strain CCMP1999" /NCGR_SAMPLE_ID=MMETSP1475 /ASSEMBLY_ACC=CAM_ASM_001111 /LENGTH=175 /DNA_ID=CAMNT_0044493145 /DNA_START=94 /DNA_END=622 /DNA_ORIENTATION=-